MNTIHQACKDGWNEFNFYNHANDAKVPYIKSIRGAMIDMNIIETGKRGFYKWKAGAPNPYMANKLLSYIIEDKNGGVADVDLAEPEEIGGPVLTPAGKDCSVESTKVDTQNYHQKESLEIVILYGLLKYKKEYV